MFRLILFFAFLFFCGCSESNYSLDNRSNYLRERGRYSSDMYYPAKFFISCPALEESLLQKSRVCHYFECAEFDYEFFAGDEYLPERTYDMRRSEFILQLKTMKKDENMLHFYNILNRFLNPSFILVKNDTDNFGLLYGRIHKAFLENIDWVETACGIPRDVQMEAWRLVYQMATTWPSGSIVPLSESNLQRLISNDLKWAKNKLDVERIFYHYDKYLISSELLIDRNRSSVFPLYWNAD